MMADSRLNKKKITSVMDVLNLWKDDPEEILLELGFGVDEPDLSGRIPARFINYKSMARGINLQVFLDAQRNRIDLENPDVSNRFRQVEVLQQVTTTLRGLVVSSTPSSVRAPSENMLSPEARERRKRMAGLFRMLSKKSLQQNHTHKPQDVALPAPVTSDATTPKLPAVSVADENVAVQGVETGQSKFSPIPDERENDLKIVTQPDPDHNHQFRPGLLDKEVSSVQEDCASPDTEKARIGDNQRHTMPESLPSGQKDFSSHLPFTTKDHLLVEHLSSSFDKPASQVDMTPNQPQPTPALESDSTTEYIVVHSSSPELQNHCENQLPPSSSPSEFDSQSSQSSLTHLASSAQEPKKPSPSEAAEASLPPLAMSNNDSNGTSTPFSKNSPPPLSNPSLDFPSVLFPIVSSTPSDSSNKSPTNTPSTNTMGVLTENILTLPGTILTPPSTVDSKCSPQPVPMDLHCTNLQPSCQPLSKNTENQLKDPLISDPKDLSLFENRDHLSMDFPIPITPVSKSTECDVDHQSLHFCCDATLPNRSSSSFAQDSSSSDGVFPTPTLVSCEHVDLKKPNSPTQQLNLRNYSSPASPVLDDAILSSFSNDTVLHDGSYLIEPPTNLSLHRDNEVPSELDCPSMGVPNLEDNESISSRLSNQEVLRLSLTDNTTNPSVVEKNISFNPTADISKVSSLLSNRNVNSLESNLGKNPINPYFQLGKDSPFETSASVLDSYRMEDTCSTNLCVSNESNLSHKSDILTPNPASVCLNKNKPLVLRNSISKDTSPIPPCPSPETFGPCRPSAVTSPSNPEPLIEEGEENNSDQKEESCLCRDYLDSTGSSGLDVNHEQVDWLIIEPAYTRESNEEAVCFSDEVLAEKTHDTSSQSEEVHELPMIHTRTEVPPTELIEMESLDIISDTSVDGYESENGDMDEFLQQLDNEGRVYWAEPIMVSESTYNLKETDSFGESPRDSLLSRSSVSLDSFPSLALPSTDPTTEDPVFFADTPSNVEKDLPSKPISTQASCSVSVQMSSSLFSHIVHRKDIPYVTNPKPTPLPGGFSLDTSSPLRAVQSWTDLQIQKRNKKLLEHGFTAPHAAYIAKGKAGKAPKSMVVYSSSPSFPLLSNRSQLQNCLPGIGRNYRNVSVSVDTGLGPDREEEMYRRGNGVSHLWEGNRSVSVACCCSHQSHLSADRSNRKQHIFENSPYSLSDLEEMMLWLQQYCSVHSNMEEELSENRASVYSSLSDIDREKIEDLEALRQAVKLEAVELEAQLKQLAHHSDESLKMKMRRLLDEQSLLCTQLTVDKLAALDVSPSNSTPSRTVATQCSLLPRSASSDMQSF